MRKRTVEIKIKLEIDTDAIKDAIEEAVKTALEDAEQNSWSTLEQDNETRIDCMRRRLEAA